MIHLSKSFCRQAAGGDNRQSIRVYAIARRCTDIGVYDMDTHKIGLFLEHMEEFIRLENSNREIHEQAAKTISHEVMHKVLHETIGEEASRGLDNTFRGCFSLAKHLEDYGLW